MPSLPYYFTHSWRENVWIHTFPKVISPMQTALSRIWTLVTVSISIMISITPWVYIYIYIYGEMVDFGKSDKMIKISGKLDKPILTTNSALIFCSLFKKELHQKEKTFNSLKIKNKISLLNLLLVLVYPLFHLFLSYIYKYI